MEHLNDKTVYIIGVFDLYHRGHVELLKKARTLGNKLIVAINSDKIVTDYKRAPIFSEDDRLELVKSCKYVDEAFIIHEFDNKEYIKKFNIDIIVHGDDWDEEGYLQQIRVTKEFLDAHGVEMKFLPYTSGVSTSGIIKQIHSINL